MELNVKGKVFLLMGASRGLGLGIAEELAANGAELLLCSRDEAAIEEAAKQIGSAAQGMACDVTDSGAIAACLNKIESDYGRLDGVLVNGGGPAPGGMDNFDDEQWYQAFELTLLSAVRLIRVCLPLLRESKGSVLAITSSSVKEPIDYLLLSNVMRSGVTSLIKSLSKTEAPNGVRLNCLVPGIIDTDRITGLAQLQAELNDSTVEAQKAEMATQVPMQRLGSADEFGRAGAFLLSPAASYITGTSLVVDGGTMRSI